MHSACPKHVGTPCSFKHFKLFLIGHEPLTFSNDYFHLPDLFDNLFDIEQDQNNGGDLLFPTLNKEQQRFAVNPAYPGYTARVFGNPTDPLDEIDIEANDEVVKDPFFSSTGQDLKKASLNPLVQDPRVLANAIEDKIYDNDIYFTSNFNITVFEITDKKSHLKYCEPSQLRLHFEWTKVD